MDFKKLFLALSLLGLSACNAKYLPEHPAEQLIGSELNNISNLYRADGTDKSRVFVFDEFARLIHHFELGDFKHLGAIEVPSPDKKHVLLADDIGDYFYDISEKNIRLVSSFGKVQSTGLELLGEPLSGAINGSLGVAVFYDKFSTVGLVKVDSAGRFEKSVTLGNLVNDTASIAAGDLNSNADLVVGLSNGSLAVVNTVNTLANGSWQVTSMMSTGTQGILWVAPVRNVAEQVIVRTQNTLDLFDTNAQLLLASFSLSGFTVVKYSKALDPHVILRSNDSTGEVRVVYVQNGGFRYRVLYHQSKPVLASYLNVLNDSWTLVENYTTDFGLFNDVNYVRDNRTLRRYRLSDMRILGSLSLANSSHVEVSSGQVLSLYPSELGYATLTNLSTEQVQQVRRFNQNLLR